MRYSIMLQLVAGISLVLVSAAALFAWIQNRPNATSAVTGDSNSNSLKVNAAGWIETVYSMSSRINPNN